MKERYFSKGVRIWTKKTDKFNTSSICFLIRQEATRQTATLNSLLIRVLGNSCEKYNTIQKINLQLEELYGASFQYNIVKKGYEQILEFCIEAQTGTEEEIISFLGEFIFKPDITEEKVNIEKRKLADYLKSKSTDKKAMALEKCIQLMCKDNGFGVCCDGYTEDIRKITAPILYNHYLQLLETAPIEIMAIGDFNFSLLQKLIPQKRNYSTLHYSTPHTLPTKPQIIEEYTPITQTKLCIGLKADIDFPEDYFKLMVFNEILGGNASSKLFTDIREAQSLCYYINSLLFSTVNIIVIQAGIEYKAKDKILEAVKNLTENMDNELDLAKKQLISSYKAIYDNPIQIMDFKLAQIILNTNYTINQIIDGINNVEDISHIKCLVDTIYILTGENNGKINNKKTEKRTESLCYS